MSMVDTEFIASDLPGYFVRIFASLHESAGKGNDTTVLRHVHYACGEETLKTLTAKGGENEGVISDVYYDKDLQLHRYNAWLRFRFDGRRLSWRLVKTTKEPEDYANPSELVYEAIDDSQTILAHVKSMFEGSLDKLTHVDDLQRADGLEVLTKFCFLRHSLKTEWGSINVDEVHDVKRGYFFFICTLTISGATRKEIDTIEREQVQEFHLLERCHSKVRSCLLPREEMMVQINERPHHLDLATDLEEDECPDDATAVPEENV